MKQASEIDREIGRRIALLRKERGVSQTALGKAIGVTFQQIQKYEIGYNRVAASRLIAVAETLGVYPADLLGFDAEVETNAFDISPEAFAMARAFDQIPKGPTKSTVRAAVLSMLKGAAEA